MNSPGGSSGSGSSSSSNNSGIVDAAPYPPIATDDPDPDPFPPTLQIAPRHEVEYPARAQLHFIPGGVAPVDKQQQKQQQQPQQQGYDLRRSVVGSVVRKAWQADQILHQYIQLSFNATQQQQQQQQKQQQQQQQQHTEEPTLFCPSLAKLCQAAFGSLTGVPPSRVRDWADAMVLHYARAPDLPTPTTEADIQTWIHSQINNNNNDDNINNNINNYDNDPLETTHATTTTTAAAAAAAASSFKNMNTNLTLSQYLKNLLLEEANKAAGNANIQQKRPCGYVFQRGDIAWNCRTCQTDSTCVICNECFRSSNHDGHEVLFHRTTPGGCCDCGDAEAWLPSGCCDAHRPAHIHRPDGDGDGDGDGDYHTTGGIETAQQAMRRGQAEAATQVSALPLKVRAALGVVIGAAVQCLVEAVDGAGVGADPIQWRYKWAHEVCQLLGYDVVKNTTTTTTTTTNTTAMTEGSQQVGIGDSTSGTTTTTTATTTTTTSMDSSNHGISSSAPSPPSSSSPPPVVGPHSFLKGWNSLPPHSTVVSRSSLVAAVGAEQQQQQQQRFPIHNYRLHLRLHNDDVHTFEEVIEALHHPGPVNGLVQDREDADDMTHHVDSDGQVTVKSYNNMVAASAGFRRLKSKGLHCAVVSTAQVDLEHRARTLASWLVDLIRVHPAASAMVVQALTDVTEGKSLIRSSSTTTTTTTTTPPPTSTNNSATTMGEGKEGGKEGGKESLSDTTSRSATAVWTEARSIPMWAGQTVVSSGSSASSNASNLLEACRIRFQAFPPHLASSYLTDAEAEELHKLGNQLNNSTAFCQMTGSDPNAYASVAYRLPLPRYRKSPHALWGTLPSTFTNETPLYARHPLLHRIASLQTPLSPPPPNSDNIRLLDDLYVVDTDLRKQQEANSITSSVYPHKLPGLYAVSGLATVGLKTTTASSSSSSSNSTNTATTAGAAAAATTTTMMTQPKEPNPMEWRHLLATSSFRAPVSPVLLLLLLDPYPTKQVRNTLHALFLSLLVDSRFKCRFAAALGGVAYRPLSTLFCAGVGTEADSPLGFTVQILTAGSIVRALGSALATEELLAPPPDHVGNDGPKLGIFSLPIAHNIVRCIHTNLLGATKELQMLLKSTQAGNGNDDDKDDDDKDDKNNMNNNNNNNSNNPLLPALAYQGGEHPLTTVLLAAPDDGFLDSRSTRHKRLPHLLRDLEYVIETPGTAIRLLLPERFPRVVHLSSSSPSPSSTNVATRRGSDEQLQLQHGGEYDILPFCMSWARLLRLAQGMDPQKRKISGGHVEYEAQRWLEAFGLSLNFAGTRDALAESPVSNGNGLFGNHNTNNTSSSADNGNDEIEALKNIRKAMGNLYTALLREMKLWLYKEGLLETGLPNSSTTDMSTVEALQRSTLHVSSSQLGVVPISTGEAGSSSMGGMMNNNTVALSCATGVKMTEVQLSLIESALKLEETQRLHRGVAAVVDPGSVPPPVVAPVMADWLRVPHSPLAGDSLSFHLPLHRALAKSIKSMCSVVVPESVRMADPLKWWKLPVLDDAPATTATATVADALLVQRQQHPLATLLRPTLRSSNCRVVWSAGPDCSPAEAQRRRARSKMVSADIASAKIIHTLADHPLRCLAAAQQIERHLWARNGGVTASMALNYASVPLCRSFRDLDLTLVQLSAAGLSVGLGARRVFNLLVSRCSMDGYLCDPERRIQAGASSVAAAAAGTAATSPTGAASSFGGSSGWVNPPRLQDPEHAVALSESFFTTVCLLVTELPGPPPTSASDESALRQSMRRELLHALAAEPRLHSEAMTAAAGAVNRRDESEGHAGASSGGGFFREVFTDVLHQVGRQKNQGSTRASSGPPTFELRAEVSDEYDPTFYHLRRHEHQHAMDNVSRLRKQKTAAGGEKGKPNNNNNDKCLPLVCAPPVAHPRFLPCRLLLHLAPMDAAIRRALMFALTGGQWLPPPQPSTPDPSGGGGGGEGGGTTTEEDNIMAAANAMQESGSSTSTITTTSLNHPTFGRRGFSARASSVKRSSSGSLAASAPPFSSSVVSSSSVSFLEVLQVLTLQVHALEECASLHRNQPELDDESKSLSAGLSINSYLGRLIHVPDSLEGVWALQPYPEGPLPSKGSGKMRGSVLGLLVALYEHRALQGGANSHGARGSAGSGDDAGGAWALVNDGMKWLLRFVNALVDGAPSVGAACNSASTGVPIRGGGAAAAASSSKDAAAAAAAAAAAVPTAADHGVSWTIDESIRSTIAGMLHNLPNLWPKLESKVAASGDGPDAKSKAARKAAQLRAMQMMKQKQAAFAASFGASGDNLNDKMLINEEEEEEEDEADLCIICRCDDADGENNGPLGYLGHVQRTRASQLRAMSEAAAASSQNNSGDKTPDLHRMYRVIGDRGCQLRMTEAMDSAALECLPVGSIVTVLKSKVSEKYGLLSRRVLVSHTATDPATKEENTVEGWASVQSSQGYVILSPMINLCYSNTRWGSTRPVVRQCGHAAHLNCVETHTLSLHQRAAGEQPYDGRYAANIDDGEFLCPLCKQLCNILVPRDCRRITAPISPAPATTTTAATDSTRMQMQMQTTPTSPVVGQSDIGASRKRLYDLLCATRSTFGEEDGMKRKALGEFGSHLLQAMEVPWERTTTTRKRQQRKWHPAIRRWDFREEEGDGISNSESSEVVGTVLQLLRQQLIAWASIGHSAASAEASARHECEKKRHFHSKSGSSSRASAGKEIKVHDPWSDYNGSSRDSHPMLLELRRTMTATSGLFMVLLDEAHKQLGKQVDSSDKASIIAYCFADIITGNYWSNGCIDNVKNGVVDKNLIMQWSILTSLISSTPIHVARDGMLSQRHEARAAAAAMWTVKGLSAGNDSDTSEYTLNPPTPYAIRQLYSSSTSIGGNKPKTRVQPLSAGWGTMRPFASVEGKTNVKVPFRPAVANASLYTPLLAWDMNSFAGALFSILLSREDQDLPNCDQLLFTAHTIVVGRMIQAMVSPGGFEFYSSDTMSSVSKQWDEVELRKESKALSSLHAYLGELKMANFVDLASEVVPDVSASKEQPHDQHSYALFEAVGRAVLPFARSVVLLLRACSSSIRQRQRKASFSSLDTLTPLLDDHALMKIEDGFMLLRELGGPLPSALVAPSSGKDGWLKLIKNWMSALVVYESHQGAGGRSIVRVVHSLVLEEAVDLEPPPQGYDHTFEIVESAKLTSEVQSSDTNVSEAGQEVTLGVAPSGSVNPLESEGEGEEVEEMDEMEEEEEEDEDMEHSVTDSSDDGARVDIGNNFLQNALEDEMGEEMEIDVEEEQEMMGFGQAVNLAAGLGFGRSVQQSAGGSNNDAFDESSDDVGSSGSIVGGLSQLDRDFAHVSRSPIVPYQPLFLATKGIGQGPRGSAFEYTVANHVMCDLSHLGMIHRKVSPSCLVSLPHSFVELYSLVNRVKARDANTMDDADEGFNSETAICLLTGAIMKSGPGRKTHARATRPPGACTLHARNVGSGIAVFFLVQKCTVLLMHNNKSAYSASLYVDEHGEEDPGLRRGRPLILNTARYSALETLWRQQGIPREVAQIRSTSDRVIRDNWY